jgi:hypothetical protein
MANSKAVKRDQKTQLIAGIQKHFKGKKFITLKGAQVNLAKLVTALQASIDAGKDTDAKRTVYLEASKTSKAADAAVDPTTLVFSDYLQSTMSAKDLADFGLKAKTRAVPDAATKAAAVKKRAATRAARGTMGPKEKRKVVGVVSTAGAPAAAQPVTTPAPTNGSAGAKSAGNETATN